MIIKDIEFTLLISSTMRRVILTTISPVQFHRGAFSFWQKEIICGKLTLSVWRTSAFTAGNGNRMVVAAMPTVLNQAMEVF